MNTLQEYQAAYIAADEATRAAWERLHMLLAVSDLPREVKAAVEAYDAASKRKRALFEQRDRFVAPKQSAAE